MHAPIEIRENFSDLPRLAADAVEDLSLKKACVITDSNIESLYGRLITDCLSPHFADLSLVSFPAGEKSKHLDTVREILMQLYERHFDRKDLIFAFGGGVTGDIAGFAASCYMRGIDFIQVPTSLLAQVDSSIGGKTGVDLKGAKNLVGAFYPPKLVYMNLSLLDTLPEREYLCGLGEITKHALILSEDYYSWLIANRSRILDRDYSAVSAMIRTSCDIKRRIVDEDPKEQGIRAILNFGHTIGHAVEKECGFSLSHGACVALGMRSAIYLSREKGLLSGAEEEKINRFLSSFGLPETIEEADPNMVLQAAYSDKKAHHGTLRFVLLKGIGRTVIENVTDNELVLSAIRRIIAGKRDSQNE